MVSSPWTRTRRAAPQMTHSSICSEAFFHLQITEPGPLYEINVNHALGVQLNVYNLPIVEYFNKVSMKF